MASLSLCMIVKNETDTLPRCLASVMPAIDELIIVDTGSTDSTQLIAKSFDAKLYEFEWIDDFSAARNFAFSKATMEYIMWLDADDILKPEDLDKLITLKNSLDGKTKQIAALYNVAFDDNGKVTFSYSRERIFKNDKSFIWSGAVHECIPLIRDTVYSDFAVTHAKLKPCASGRNLEIYNKIRQRRSLLPRELYYYARELYYNDFIEMSKQSFLSFLKTDGWFINKIDACLLISKCYLADKNNEQAKIALFNSFLYGEPTAEICCELGRLFMISFEYSQAIYWYNVALSRIPNSKSGSFINYDDYTYTPAIQLCVCYDKIGDINKSIQFNDLAGKFKPSSGSVELNKKYFAHLKDIALQ